VDVLHDLTRRALERHLANGPHGLSVSGSLFNAAELRELIEWLSSVVATGDLLGRYRVRERMLKAGSAGGFHRFADESELPFAAIPETVPILPPVEALRFFTRLVPLVGKDAVVWGVTMQRAAFTLAQATEKTLLAKVQGVITDRLRTGRDWSTAPADIEHLLTEAGIHPANPQYAQMVFRTNVMDSFNVGMTHELEEPVVKDFFPVWQYLGILDGREGDDHRPKFNRYYPNSVPFHVARGPRVYNCRCSQRPIDKYEWAELKSKGAKLSYA
jgi:hypothetical protein